jgi:hypothetical protein
LEAERFDFSSRLDEREKEIQELQHDVREMDMKSSSLQVSEFKCLAGSKEPASDNIPGNL